MDKIYTTASQPPVSPTQADREIAADWQTRCGYAPHVVQMFRDGRVDNSPIVQAFAAHRQHARDAGFAQGWAKATAWHKHGIAWKHLERASQDELLADARKALSAEANEGRCDAEGGSL